MTSRPSPSLWRFIAVLLLGLLLFIIPDIFFGIGINGGKQGLNLFYMGAFQLLAILSLLYFDLRSRGKTFADIGWPARPLWRDVLLGLLAGLVWMAIQYVLIPATGGADRPDIQGMLSMYDGSIPGLFSFLALGVLGGGIAEELFFRAYFIGEGKTIADKPAKGLRIAAFFSILVFALTHMPVSLLDWVDIMIPTVAYTLLFLYTGRVTASIVAHSVYNALAILFVYYTYYL